MTTVSVIALCLGLAAQVYNQEERRPVESSGVERVSILAPSEEEIPAGTLSGTATYEDGTKAWAGISVKDADGKVWLPPFHIPIHRLGKFEYGIDGETWFVFGDFTLPVAPGSYTVTVKPLEGWLEETKEIEVSADAEATVDFVLRRNEEVDPSTRIRISVFEDGKPQAARLTVTAKDPESGKHIPITPVGVMGRHWRLKHHWYHVWGGCEVVIPADITGPINVHSVRGTEYEFFNEDVTPEPGGVVDVKIDLHRWINLAEENWYSGDVHTHLLHAAGPKSERRSPLSYKEHAFQIHQAEDMMVGCWLICPGDPNANREGYEKGPYKMKFDQEPRNSTYGHLHALLLRYPVEQFNAGKMFNKHDFPSNLPIIKAFHEAGAVVGYAHPAAGGSNLDLMNKLPYLKEVQGINHTAICRGIVSDIVNDSVELLEVYSWSSGEDAAEELWYNLLDCGFDIMPNAGTDAFNGGLPQTGVTGGLRSYVYVEGELTYRKWVEAMAKGVSFMTSGPALLLEVDGNKPGATLDFESPKTLKASVRLRSNLPVDVVQVLAGGEVVKTFNVGDRWRDFNAECDVTIEESSYLTARARLNRNFPILLEEEVRALTGPVLVNIAGKTRSSAKSAAIFVRWLKEFKELLDTKGAFRNDEEKQQVFGELDAALPFYEKMAGMDQDALETIYFDFDQSGIDPAQLAALEKNKDYLAAHPDTSVAIEAHCDASGTSEYNFTLGERRAKTVREWLVSKGIDPERLTVVSKGEEEPAVDESDGDPAKNRRVELKFMN